MPAFPVSFSSEGLCPRTPARASLAASPAPTEPRGSLAALARAAPHRRVFGAFARPHARPLAARCGSSPSPCYFAARAGAQTQPRRQPRTRTTAATVDWQRGRACRSARGNTSASNLNVSFEATHGAKTDKDLEIQGGSISGVTTTARRRWPALSLGMQHERTFDKRWWLRQPSVLRDQFQDIPRLPVGAECGHRRQGHRHAGHDLQRGRRSSA